MTSTDPENAILAYLSSSPSTIISDSYMFSNKHNISHNDIVGAMKSLDVDAYISHLELTTSYYTLCDEAFDIITNGSQEKRVLKYIINNPNCEFEMVQKECRNICKIGVGNCLKYKWIKKEGAILNAIVDNSVKDMIQEYLMQLEKSSGSPNMLKESEITLLKRRKLITLNKRTYYRISRGINYQSKRIKKASDLTKDIIDSGSWKSLQFKPYNFLTLGDRVTGGYLHPLLKVKQEFRKILLCMGFQEMPTNQWVESSFWNFDSLFQPQSHPARDAHDTFFLKNPKKTLKIPEDYYENVKNMHENGGTGSIGYNYKFERKEAMKNVLRTHTTAISSKMLYELAKKTNELNKFEPQRYFSIDRVFRNETMDATHLCEFHQVEGLVADYDLSLGDLMGTIDIFFKRIGIKNIRYKPAYNPYTEPSMEIFGYHPDLQKWTEIGNSGIFRPEMLIPMGLPDSVRVIAWGLSLERPTMIKYGIKNIRELSGHKVELMRVKNSPICRFDDVS